MTTRRASLKNKSDKSHKVCPVIKIALPPWQYAQHNPDLIIYYRTKPTQYCTMESDGENPTGTKLLHVLTIKHDENILVWISVEGAGSKVPLRFNSVFVVLFVGLNECLGWKFYWECYLSSFAGGEMGLQEWREKNSRDFTSYYLLILCHRRVNAWTCVNIKYFIFLSKCFLIFGRKMNMHIRKLNYDYPH